MTIPNFQVLMDKLGTDITIEQLAATLLKRGYKDYRDIDQSLPSLLLISEAKISHLGLLVEFYFASDPLNSRREPQYAARFHFLSEEYDDNPWGDLKDFA